MKKIIYLVAAFLCMACSDDHGANQENGGASGGVTEVTPVTVSYTHLEFETKVMQIGKVEE